MKCELCYVNVTHWRQMLLNMNMQIGVRGGARTGCLIPGCDGDGAWTQPENSSAVAVAAAAVRPKRGLSQKKAQLGLQKK